MCMEIPVAIGLPFPHAKHVPAPSVARNSLWLKVYWKRSVGRADFPTFVVRNNNKRLLGFTSEYDAVRGGRGVFYTQTVSHTRISTWKYKNHKESFSYNKHTHTFETLRS